MEISPPRGICTLGQGGGKDDKGDSNAETLGIGVEQLLYQGEQAAQDATQAQEQTISSKGLSTTDKGLKGAADHSFGHAKGDGKDHQTYCVIRATMGRSRFVSGPLALYWFTTIMVAAGQLLWPRRPAQYKWRPAAYLPKPNGAAAGYPPKSWRLRPE